jgi:threonyl-tRNA synthetase
MVILGDKEVQNGTVSVRTRKGGDQGSISREEFLSRVHQAIQSRQIEP